MLPELNFKVCTFFFFYFFEEKPESTDIQDSGFFQMYLIRTFPKSSRFLDFRNLLKS